MAEVMKLSQTKGIKYFPLTSPFYFPYLTCKTTQERCFSWSWAVNQNQSVWYQSLVWWLAPGLERMHLSCMASSLLQACVCHVQLSLTAVDRTFSMSGQSCSRVQDYRCSCRLREEKQTFVLDQSCSLSYARGFCSCLLVPLHYLSLC